MEDINFTTGDVFWCIYTPTSDTTDWVVGNFTLTDVYGPNRGDYNVFKTKMQAEKALAAIKEVLRKIQGE